MQYISCNGASCHGSRCIPWKVAFWWRNTNEISTSFRIPLWSLRRDRWPQRVSLPPPLVTSNETSRGARYQMQDIGKKPMDARHWVINTRCKIQGGKTPDARHWVPDTRSKTQDARRGMLDTGCQIPEARHQTQDHRSFVTPCLSVLLG